MAEDMLAGGTDLNLQILNTNQNLGFARGVNFALSIDEMNDQPHDAYLLLNNDAVAMPGMVNRLATALAAPDMKMVAPVVVDTAGKPQPMLWYQRFLGLQTAYPLPGSFPYLSGCCLLVRRGMPGEGGLLDEEFFMYGEDTLLGWRCARAGRRTLRVGDAFVCHDSTGSSRRGQWFYEYHMARAHVLLAKKTLRHSAELPMLLACKGLSLSLRALWRALRYKNVVPLKAFFMAWRALDVRVP
jgi:GT2 family glycosyltransferase